ncbi:MAG TPA: type II secretion system protein GspG [Acidobacteriota bacterium]|nr:type II secretion system protein GspG [Acidobacteriota bacterium]
MSPLHPTIYRAPGRFGDYELISPGADGQAGGAGDNADIVAGQPFPHGPRLPGRPGSSIGDDG